MEKTDALVPLAGQCEKRFDLRPWNCTVPALEFIVYVSVLRGAGGYLGSGPDPAKSVLSVPGF